MAWDLVRASLHPLPEAGLDLLIGLVGVQPTELQAHHLDARFVQVDGGAEAVGEGGHACAGRNRWAVAWVGGEFFRSRDGVWGLRMPFNEDARA